MQWNQLVANTKTCGIYFSVISSCPTTWAKCRRRRRRRRHWVSSMSWKSPSITLCTRSAMPQWLPAHPHPPPQSKCPSSPRSPPPTSTVKTPLASSHPSPSIPWKPRWRSGRKPTNGHPRQRWASGTGAPARRLLEDSLGAGGAAGPRSRLPSPSDEGSLLLALYLFIRLECLFEGRLKEPHMDLNSGWRLITWRRKKDLHSLKTSMMFFTWSSHP